MKKTEMFYLFLASNLFFLSLIINSLKAQNQKISEGRIKFTINEDWKFNLNGDEKILGKEFDDSNREKINLPHTWNREDAFDENKQYYRGTGWYSKNLNISPEWRSKKIFIYFEGSNQVTDVYINGNHVGQHIGGYTAFIFDITEQLKLNQTNILTVKVDNSHNSDIPPLNADFTFYGGIYRDVWLIITDPVHIDILNYASPGIFIDAPEISNEQAKIRINGTIVNERNNPTEVEIVNRILDKDNSEVAVFKSKLEIKNNSKENFKQEGIIKRPYLWSPDNPYLYKVQTEIFEGDILVDEITNPLGFRWFSFNPDSGFYLNSKPLKLIGTNRHQDFEGFGNALPDSLHIKDVQTIRENGFNFLRLAHYPQDPSVIQSADKLGLIIWEEIPIVNIITMSNAFNDNCKTMLREMIRQHYNHPSILFWGYMNEVMLVKPDTIPEGYYDAVLELAKELEEILKEEDTTRASVMALSYGEIENGTGIENISDILGMNLYFGWYYEKLETLREFLDGYHQRNPARPIMISEYGAGSDERVHSFHPKAFDFSAEYQQIFHEKTFPQILEREYIIGSAVWNQFDFGSNHRQDTKPLINQKGLYYFDRKPKDISYYYKAILLVEPVLYMAVEDWKYRASNSIEKTNHHIKIYTNLDSVSLFNNDELIGKFSPTNSTILLSINLADGLNKIRASGKFKDEIINVLAEVYYQNLNSFFDDHWSGKNIFALNSGSEYEFIDEEKITWLADSPNNYGWEITGGQPIKTHHRILNTKDEPLFQTALEVIEGYKFNLAEGKYEVELCLAEIQFDKPGERVFNIFVNDVPAFLNLDLADEYGGYHAVRKTININCENKEGILIRFESIIGKPVINGLKIERVN